MGSLERAEWVGVSGLFPEFHCRGVAAPEAPVRNPSCDRGPSGNCAKKGELHFSEASRARGESLTPPCPALPCPVGGTYKRGCTSHSGTLSWDLIMQSSGAPSLDRFHSSSRYAFPHSYFARAFMPADNFASTVFACRFLSLEFSQQRDASNLNLRASCA